jgi:hypothetical protein
MVCFDEYHVFAMTILTPDHAKGHFKIRRRGFWFGTDGSTRLGEHIILTPKERAMSIAIVAVMVVAIALVVMIEH